MMVTIVMEMVMVLVVMVMMLLTMVMMVMIVMEMVMVLVAMMLLTMVMVVIRCHGLTGEHLLAFWCEPNQIVALRRGVLLMETTLDH